MVNTMKNYYFSYRNTKGDIVYDNTPVLAHDVFEAETKMLDHLRQWENPFFERKDILEVRDTPFTNKKYYFNWYNYVAQQDQVDFVMAENLTQAKQMAVLIMQFFAGSRYTIDDINNIDELTDSYFYTMDDIKERYEKCGKKFILPEIKEEEDD